MDWGVICFKVHKRIRNGETSGHFRVILAQIWLGLQKQKRSGIRFSSFIGDIQTMHELAWLNVTIYL